MDGYVTIGTELDTKEFDAQMKYIERKMLDIEDKLKQADMGFEVGDTEKLEAEYEKLGNQLLGLKEKQEKYNQSIREAQMAGFNKIKESVDGVGNSLQKVTKRIAKMALAVFGIRSAFMFVRSAINTIAGDDEQLKADIDYMKSAIAYTLEPVVRGIVNLAKQLMFYVAYIIKAWTGKNIFENANKSLKGANKQAKALSKQLAGFDEMNVLNDSSSGSGGGVTPSFDLTAPEDVPIPGWVKWIAENKDVVIAGLMGIAGALVAVKLLGLDPILSLGIGIAIAGIISLIQDIIKFIKDPSWNNFANILKDLAIILAGVAIAMLAVNAANPVAWILLAIAAVAALAAAVIKHWDEIKGVLGVVGSWIYDHIIKPIGDLFTNLWNGIVNGLKWAVDLIKNTFNNVVNFFRNIVSNIINLFREIGIKVGDVIGGAFKGVVNGVLRAVENILNTPIRTINSLIRTINTIPGINIGTLREFRLPRLAKGGIINQPGRGIPVGSAIAGERGQEGVIPLTDSQQMDLLGQAIARHMVINNFVDNYIDGRKLNRILQSSNDRTRFAMNGG